MYLLECTRIYDEIEIFHNNNNNLTHFSNMNEYTGFHCKQEDYVN